MKKSLLALAILLSFALPALADSACNAKTTRGFWVYTCDGYLANPPNTALQPARILGTCNATDGALFTCEGSVNFAGQVILPQVLSGVAHTEANCTGTISYQQPYDLPNLNIRYVILDGGDLIKGLPIDPDQVLSCVLNRISKHGDR